MSVGLPRLAASAAAALLLMLIAGCTTVPKQTLGPGEVAALSLQSVSVRFAPDAAVSFAGADGQFTRERGLSLPASAPRGDNDDPAASAQKQRYFDALRSPDAAAYRQARIEGSLREAVSGELQPAMRGSRPVVAEVVVRQVNIPDAVMKNLIGGAYILSADFLLKDAETNEAVAAYPNLVKVDNPPSGVLGLAVEGIRSSDPLDRLSRGYAASAKRWLLP